MEMTVDEIIQDILVYEFGENYFVIQRSQQGKNPVSVPHAARASENVDLYAKLPFTCSEEELGKAAIGALDNYDKVLPLFDPWELGGLNKQLCTWLETRYFATITKNSRLVQLIRDRNLIKILPFDNYNKNYWYGPMTKDTGFKKDFSVTVSTETVLLK